MNILFYSSFNSRARDAESLMLAFKDQGHTVISLSQAKGIDINPALNDLGISAVSHEVRDKQTVWFILKHVLYLIKFCKKESVSIVFCHLETPSLVGVLSQFFIRAKVYVCRHHIDEAKLYGFDKSISYKLIYRLAKHIIVVSKHAKKFMIEQEGIEPKKIIHINLGYDFSLFTKPRSEAVEQIKKKYPADVLLINVGRLTEFKRPNLSIEVLKDLLKHNINAKLIILGNGPMDMPLKKQVQGENLNEKVFFTGHVGNVLDYMKSSDFLIHPSVLESSCVVVKEAGLANLPVVACAGVGDFDEYIVHTKNGFLVAKDNFVREASETIKRYSNDKEMLISIGQELHKDVIEIFSIENIFDSYNKLISE